MSMSDDMIIDLSEFKIKILEMIAITNRNIKTEIEYLERLKAQRHEGEGYWSALDPENPYLLIPAVEATIKGLDEKVRTYEAVISIAKSLAY